MKRVLVIDDHAYIRETLVELLSNEAGLTVVGWGADGDAAVQLTDELKPDVVVMDVQMAGADGAEATREIVRRHDETRVVILTATPHGQLAARATRHAGACRRRSRLPRQVGTLQRTTRCHPCRLSRMLTAVSHLPAHCGPARRRGGGLIVARR
jgi:CheY-like chemotaxis protein